ncbi:ATP-dependent RecD-like DNA helicase [Streptomyces gobiensis]|nr:ATP-dependent RecD-like DNA helicase [Streptomyces gobiensis]UGY90517.1 ATP-dependent RecD-like DNA helicase [Streptomyces gobiensis]
MTIPQGPQGKAAELLAAVRAVESGERSAAEFFAAPEPASRPRRAATPTPAPTPAAGEPGPVTVPDEVRTVLAEGGAPESLGRAVVAALGQQAAEGLREDPWRLLAVAGVRPEQADSFARALLGAEARGCGPDEPRRAQALVVWLLERAARSGHTALEATALGKGLAQYGVPDPEGAVREAVEAGAVLAFHDIISDGSSQPTAGEAEEIAGAGEAGEAGEEQPVRILLGLDRWALAEESLADGLNRLVNTFAPPGEEDTAASRSAWEDTAAAAVSPSTAELIRAAAGSGLVVHTGGEAARAEPAALVAAARALGLRACAAVHSEDGRQRLAALIGTAARADEESAEEPLPAVVTVAGLLAGREGPGRDEDGAYDIDLLAVLDAPQLDAETAATLVESLPDGARLVLSGDPRVLGAAGAGQVLTDLLAARICPQVASRTPDPGPVGELVSGIGIGELGQVAAPGKEVVIVPVRDAGEAVHRTVQLVADSVPRAIGVPTEQTQVITPGHGGAAGTRVLNAALKERLNPGPGRFGGFDPGDRVVCSPAAGRSVIGSVVSADADGLRLECAGHPVTVARERVAETVRHGWAVTAHQAAGQRWPAAVVVLPGDAVQALDRAWVYTAFGRAERHLSVVQGVDQALPHAVAERPAPERMTRLRGLLRG